MAENSPHFIREFSKETDQSGRDETARLIMEKRAERRSVEARITQLEADLSDISNSWLSRMMNKSKINSIQGKCIHWKKV